MKIFELIRSITKGLPQSSLKKQVIDQGAHIFCGIALVVIALHFGAPPVAAFVFSVGFEVVREWLQNDRSFKFGKGSIMDIAFWVLGAAIGLVW